MLPADASTILDYAYKVCAANGRWNVQLLFGMLFLSFVSCY